MTIWAQKTTTQLSTLREPSEVRETNMASGKQTLESWIHEAMTDGDKEHSISALSLVHMVGQAEREIHSTKFGSKQWTARDLAQLFRHKAESYCQDIPGVQSFCILAFYGTDEDEARHPFMINGDTDLGGLSTESPDAKGMTQQGMRHIEAITQINLRGVAHNTDTAVRMNEMLLRMNADLMKENREGFALMKEVLAAQALNRHEFVMKEKQYERSTQERRKWLDYAPVLLNTVLGSEVFPQSSEDTTLIESIADSLSEEDLMKLSSTLKPEVLGPIAARFEKHYKAKNAKEAKNTRMLNAKNPEDDAAGD
jgi:hypothetical protein